MKAFIIKDGDVYPDRLVDGVEAVRANLEARLSVIQGEYMPNVVFGLPLGATKDETDLNVQKIILDTEGVTGIIEFKSTLLNKVYNCRFKATTQFGDIIYG